VRKKRKKIRGESRQLWLGGGGTEKKRLSCLEGKKKKKNLTTPVGRGKVHPIIRSVTGGGEKSPFPAAKKEERNSPSSPGKKRRGGSLVVVE